MKILIVEDDEMIADVISWAFQAGYQCQCAYDGLEAAGLLEDPTGMI